MESSATSPDIRLNSTDEAIIDEIEENGRATVTMLAKTLDKSNEHIRNRVKRMWEHGILIEPAPRLYDIADREDDYKSRGIELES